MKLPMMVSVRGFAVPIRDDEKAKPAGGKPPKLKALRKPSRETLVFDCETLPDHTQRFRFGTYQCRRKSELVEQGIFYESNDLEALSESDLATIRAYAAKHGLTLLTREEFVETVFYRYAYAYEAAVVGFNLPFDLSRLAIDYATSHAKDMRGGFSFKLSLQKNRPTVLVKHLNGRAALIRFATIGQRSGRAERKHGFRREHRTGFFQDLRSLGGSLLGKGHSLKSLADALQTEHRKLAIESHGGALTSEYLDYAMTDTQVTWECYEKLLEIYGGHNLSQTPAHRVLSEAGLGKGYLREMGILPLGKVQPDVSPELLGQIMGAYYGGRSEVRIRRELRRVIYCDFRSMYPTVCTLMGLWRFVVAKGFDAADWTDECRALLDKIGICDLQDKETWKALTVLVQVEPYADVFPVRAAYDGTSRNIGSNYLTAEFPMWFTLADCIASKLFTGKAPKMVQALRFTPREMQGELKSIKIGEDIELDPAKSDLFRELIVLRGKIQSAEKAEIDPIKKQALAAQQSMLKLVANSTSYGIYAEQNPQSYDRPQPAQLYGSESSFRIGAKSLEQPGAHFHPLIATLITGAARLMLATAECLAASKGIGWVFCDTDSLAFAKPDEMSEADFVRECKSIIDWFEKLEPYGDGISLLKLEDENFALKDGKASNDLAELFCVAISAKRYALCNIGSNGRPILRKVLAHGLGHLTDPYTDADAPLSIPAPSVVLKDCKRWQHDLWYRIVCSFLDGHPDQVDLSDFASLDKPAKSRYSATTPALLSWFKQFNEKQPRNRQVRPFNFMSGYSVFKPAFAEALARNKLPPELNASELPAPVSTYSQAGESKSRFFDRKSGVEAPAAILKTYRQALAEYPFHAESKFENAGQLDCGLTVRRHVHAVAVEYIGKEANQLEQQYFMGKIPNAIISYGMSQDGLRAVLALLHKVSRECGQSVLAERAGITRQQLAAICSEEATPTNETFKRLAVAIAASRASERTTGSCDR